MSGPGHELGGAQPLGDYLSSLGYEFLLQGDYEWAATLNEEAATLLRNKGHRGGLQYALDNLGWRSSGGTSSWPMRCTKRASYCAGNRVPDPVKVNNNLTYTLKVTNYGYDSAPGVVLTDRLPSGVTFVSASSGCTHAAGKVTCKLGSVAGITSTSPTGTTPIGTTVSRTITVKPTAQDTITNTAPVKSSAVELTYTDNNSDRERTQVTLNRAPVANDNSYVTKEDTPLTISAPGVLSNDTDPDSDQLTVANVVETTSGGTLTLNSNGSFTYTPNTNFNGADASTYKATDGSAQSNVATVTMVVRAVNDAPNAADDSAQTAMNTPLTINVLSNDRDPKRDEMSITEVSDPAHGTEPPSTPTAL